MSSGTLRKKGIAVLFLLFVAAGYFALKMVALPPRGDFDYVAMGSSFAAGPGIGQRAKRSYWPCWRSESNYPHRFAQLSGLLFNDVSCSGATTSNLLDGGQFLQPAQVDAVGPETQVVTITVGGNDVFYLGNLTAAVCMHQPEKVSFVQRALGLCRPASQSRVQEAFDALPRRLTLLVTAIRQRSPHARIVFVDYTTILPGAGTCAALGLSGKEADVFREMAHHLSAITRQVAVQTNAGLVEASQLTQNHDVCSAEPWVNGFVFPKHMGDFGPAPFHPKQEAMDRTAQELLRIWKS